MPDQAVKRQRSPYQDEPFENFPPSRCFDFESREYALPHNQNGKQNKKFQLNAHDKH
jgi:hypothetical protein